MTVRNKSLRKRKPQGALFGLGHGNLVRIGLVGTKQQEGRMLAFPIPIPGPSQISSGIRGRGAQPLLRGPLAPDHDHTPSGTDFNYHVGWCSGWTCRIGWQWDSLPYTSQKWPAWPDQRRCELDVLLGCIGWWNSPKFFMLHPYSSFPIPAYSTSNKLCGSGQPGTATALKELKAQ